jgi:hypothetical protein
MTPLPYETTVKDVVVRIESRLAQNPNVRDKISAVLKNGPKAYRCHPLRDHQSRDERAPPLVLKDHLHRPLEDEGVEY